MNQEPRSGDRKVPKLSTLRGQRDAFAPVDSALFRRFNSLPGTFQTGTSACRKHAMHTYGSIFLHLVFGTAGHLPLLDPTIRARVHAYLGGTARALDLAPLAIGGVDDHVHMLGRLSTTASIGDVVGRIKGNSSRWINETFTGRPKFGWQRGYGAFSVSFSALTRVRRYIERQEEHHRTRSFAEEVAELLRLHQMQFDIDDLLS